MKEKQKQIFSWGCYERNKSKRMGKPEILELKKQSKSEMKYKTVFDKIPSIQKSASNMRTISEEEK